MKNTYVRYVLAGLIVITMISGLLLLIKNNHSQTDGNVVHVVASYYPLYDFAKHVGGNKVHVVNITPAGAEPHDYEPTPQQLVKAEKADVFIYNGATLEVWAHKFLPDYTHTVVEASRGIKLNKGIDETTGKSSTQLQDPHFWLDPVLATQIVDNIRDGLVKTDPAHSDYYRAQASAYNDKLLQLDADFRTGLASCQSRSVITSHAAFSYVAKRYNLDIVAIAGVSPDAEPSAAKLAELSRLVRDKRIQYIFYESLVSPKLAQTIANETGAKTAVFDPIEGISNEDQQKGKDYISVQRQNLVNLRTALACR